MSPQPIRTSLGVALLELSSAPFSGQSYAW